MKIPEKASIVPGILAVIGLTKFFGQWGRLEHWVREEAIEAMEWRRPLPYFFAPLRGESVKRR